MNSESEKQLRKKKRKKAHIITATLQTSSSVFNKKNSHFLRLIFLISE